MPKFAYRYSTCSDDLLCHVRQIGGVVGKSDTRGAFLVIMSKLDRDISDES